MEGEKTEVLRDGIKGFKPKGLYTIIGKVFYRRFPKKNSNKYIERMSKRNS